MVARAMTGLIKPLWFSSAAGVGSLLAAVAAVTLLPLVLPVAAPSTSGQTKTLPVTMCLVIDCSGSMDGEKIVEVKRAANAFISRQNLTRDRIAVVGFGTNVLTPLPLSQDRTAIENAIGSLADGGSTNMGPAIEAAAQTMQGTSGERFVVLFTDGQPDSVDAARQAATQLRQQGIKFVAIATSDADHSFLAECTADPKLVFAASLGSFELAFRQAEEVIRTPDLTRSTASDESNAITLLRAALTTALLACGILLSLMLAQAVYLKRRPRIVRDLLLGTLGACVAGAIAGAFGQLIFAVQQFIPPELAGTWVAIAARMIGWMVLGLLLGLGISFFVPNLGMLRGPLGGLVGGLIGAVSFLVIDALLDDPGPFLVSAACLGLFIGIMVAVIEAAFREAWLNVIYGPGEVRTVTLGAEPVSVGGDNGCTIFIPGAPAVAAKYQFAGGVITLHQNGHAQAVQPGHRHNVGKVVLEVCGKGQATALTTSAESRSTATEHRTPTGMALRLPGGERELWIGETLLASDLRPASGSSGREAVAEVFPHPQDPHTYGLKNLSRSDWSVVLAHGDHRPVPPGKSVKLVATTKINFGTVQGEIVTKSASVSAKTTKLR